MNSQPVASLAQLLPPFPVFSVLGRLARILPLVFCIVVPATWASITPLGDVAKIVDGGIHSCALTTTGGVKCWGFNTYGGLGDGTLTNRQYAVDVVGLGSGVTALAAGYYHTCALTAGGAVKCWGLNESGQLGDGSTTNRNTPVDVAGLASGVKAIGGGAFHTCAVMSSGAAKCWGFNENGQLGDGSSTDGKTPVDVAGLSGSVVSVAGGWGHTCVLNSAGGMQCWGGNWSGQIGDGSTTNRSAPVAVTGLSSGVAAIGGGWGESHTCALTTAGGVKCWGGNVLGQLGINSTAGNSAVPQDAAGLSSGVVEVTHGGLHTCAVLGTGAVKCWGANSLGQLGDGSTTQRNAPVDVAGLAGATAVAAGYQHSCARTSDGRMQCWGRNAYGQLGDAVIARRPIPVEVSAVGSAAAAVDAGALFSCALTQTGGVKCWGRNANYQVGDGTNIDRPAPADVGGLSSGVSLVSTGGAHACALTTGGGVKCWGGSSRLGDGTNFNRGTPGDVTGLGSGVTALSAGDSHTCAVSVGGVQCWGFNSSGQLGDNSTTLRLTPVAVVGLASGISAVASGGSHSCALTSGGGVKCWGLNSSGQLGDGSTSNRLTPVDVQGLSSGVVAISAGDQHTCALTSGGGVKCWGNNPDGALGDGFTANQPTPVNVSGLTSGVVGIAAGLRHTCAVTASGAAKCWGWNGEGQLGDLSVSSRSKPVNVSGLSSGVTAIAAGWYHSCVRTSSGAVKCWGGNGSGQVGDGTAAFSTAPVAVVTMDSGLRPSVRSGSSHSLAIDKKGAVLAWGNDGYGQLGQGRKISVSTPVQVAGLPPIGHVSYAGHVLAVDGFQRVWSWGSNSCAELGPRDLPETTRPQRVNGITGVSRVAAGECFSLALRSDGTVWGWGKVPGYGSETGVRQLSGLSGIVEIAAGRYHALARTSDGKVLSFGFNISGELGRGTTNVVQTAAEVPGLAGVTAISAGMSTSMALQSGGQIQAWGSVGANFAAVSSPRVLPAVGGSVTGIATAPDHVSSVGGPLYAIRSDGVVVKYNSSPEAWVTSEFSGFPAAARVAVSINARFGTDASGQVRGSGDNYAGQLGQGDTSPKAEVVAVPGMANVIHLVTIRNSVVTLKSDGSVWFWGQNVDGESGDGAAVAASVPSVVAIPATVRDAAAAAQFSVAIDASGDAWGWGSNSTAALDDTLVNRATPTRISGVTNAQAVATTRAGVIYLLADGTVATSGQIAPFLQANGATLISGMSGITAIAAGTFAAYALRNDNVLLALGDNNFGQLGDGTTASRSTPGPVVGISGTIVKVSAGGHRAGAVTSDGKVWMWGAGPLGNGGTANATTAVQVAGIADAVELSVGSDLVLVLRKDGSVVAWGDVGLADAVGKDPLKPYALTFAGTVAAVSAGGGSKLGFLVDANGVAWGFGKYGTAVSAASAALGDGAYVARERPAALKAAAGAGSVDANDWYLDLDPATSQTIPAASTPKAQAVAELSGSSSALAVSAKMKYKAADLGKRVNNYVFGLVPVSFFQRVKAAPILSSKARLEAKAAKAGGFVLAQLTPAGWADVTGQLIAYSQATASAAGSAASILSGIDATAIAGARFCIGYGENSGSMLSFSALSEVLLLEGASANTSGVPCVLTGVYVDGPPTSRSGTAVSFRASVVGLNPTGSVQFTDGAANVGSTLALAAASDAVANATLTTSALALGPHAIGVVYGGDRQNSAATTEIPVRHEVANVQPGASSTALAGPASSEIGDTVVFVATVTGDGPTGTVQFADGSANLGSAVPLVEGLATLRASALAQGTHTITAAYSGDAKNATSTSIAIAHAVAGAIATTLSLSSNAESVTAGAPVTFTVTVTGNNPTGIVTFRDGATVIGTAQVLNGIATLTVPDLGAGQHTITAEYAGDSGNAAASSAAHIQRVTTSAQTYVLTVGKSGAGSGKVTSSPERVDCGSACAMGFPAGTAVTLTATPESGSKFEGWSGACTGVGTCTLTLDGAKSVTAAFGKASGSRLVNIATRAPVLTGDSVVIGGFTISGTAPKRVLVTARGPSMAAQGVTGTLANPVLFLYSGATVIAANDDWSANANAADITATGVGPADSKEAALLVSLDPGAYTAVVVGADNTTGIGIVEAFEVDKPEVPLINIATRAPVFTGDNVLIGGFTIQGDVPMQVLLTARGPSLAAQGVPGVLADPVLFLYSGATVIAANDNWGSNDNTAAIQATGVAPTDPKEAALLVTLNPGAYTTIVVGANSGTGIGIVEVFAK